MINLFWITGNFQQRKNVINKIKESLESFELEIYDAVSLDLLTLMTKQMSCFSSNKLIIINDWPEDSATSTKYTNKMLAFIKAVPDNIVLIFNNLKGRSKKVPEYIGENGKRFDFDSKMPKKNCFAFLRTYFQNNKKDIENESLNYIVESMTKYDYNIEVDALYLSALKICTYVGNRTKIKHEDVVKCQNADSTFIIWTLLDALDAKDLTKAIDALDDALCNSNNILSEMQFVISTMLWRYNLLVTIKEYAVKNKDADIKEYISNFVKIKSEGSQGETKLGTDTDAKGNIASAYSDKLIQSIMNGNYYKKAAITAYDRVHLFQITLLLQRLNYSMRQGVGRNIKRVILNGIIMFICKKLSYKDVNTMIGDIDYGLESRV